MGGNVFQGTSDFDQKDIPAMMAQINPILAKLGIKGHVIGSGATPTAGKMSGDLDVMVDQDVLAQKFKIDTPKDIKIALEKLYQQAGFETAKSGVNVHVCVPSLQSMVQSMLSSVHGGVPAVQSCVASQTSAPLQNTPSSQSPSSGV